MGNGFIFAFDSSHLFAATWGMAEESFAAAPIALVHNLTLVPRNVEDFAATGVRMLNPWEAFAPLA